jgi:hypothetical protein
MVTASFNCAPPERTLRSENPALWLVPPAAAALLWAAGAGWPAPAIVKLVLIAPIVEELFFRAFVHAALMARAARRRGLLSRANLATAALFGAAHLLYAPAPHAALVMLPALAIGWVYERTGRVAPCVALHAAMNFVWILFHFAP